MALFAMAYYEGIISRGAGAYVCCPNRRGSTMSQHLQAVPKTVV